MSVSIHYLGATGRRMFNTDQPSLALFLTNEVSATDIHVLDVVALSDTIAYRLVQTPATESTSYAQLTIADTAVLFAALGKYRGDYTPDTSYLRYDIVRRLPVDASMHNLYTWSRTEKSTTFDEDLARGALGELIDFSDAEAYIEQKKAEMVVILDDVTVRQADVVDRQADVIVRQAAVAANLLLTNADVVTTNADVVAAALSETNAAASALAAGGSETAAAASALAAGLSEVAAQTAETNAAASAVEAADAVQSITYSGYTLDKALYSAGTAAAFTIAGSDSNQPEFMRFTKRFVVAIPDWTPSADVVLYDNVSANYGTRVSVLTDGTIRYEIGNGASLTAYDSSAQIAFGGWQAAEFVCYEDVYGGTLSVWVNGVALITAADTSAQLEHTRTGGDHRLLSDGTSHFEGLVAEDIIFRTGEISGATVASRFANPLLWQAELTVNGVGEVTSTDRDMSGAGNWSASGGGIVTANYDSGDALHGSTLRIQADPVGDGINDRADLSGQITIKDAQENYRLQFDAKIVQGSYMGVGFSAGTVTAVVQLLSGLTSQDLANGWKRYLYEFDGKADVAPVLRFYATDGSGSGAVSDEVLVDNVTLESEGVAISQSVMGIVTPSFTDTTRPTAPVTGTTIFNTDDGALNIWDGTQWTLSDGTAT